MTVGEVAKLEHVRVSVVYRWIRCAYLAAEHRPIAEGGRQWVWIEPAEYQRFAQSHHGEQWAQREKQRLARNREEWAGSSDDARKENSDE